MGWRVTAISISLWLWNEVSVLFLLFSLGTVCSGAGQSSGVAGEQA
jgi:hypothetical protein